MSVSEPNYVTNATFLEEQESTSSRLSAGSIALITIGSAFFFYMTLMFIVCAGEYWQYVKGKKRQKATERQDRISRALAESKGSRTKIVTLNSESASVTQLVNTSQLQSQEPDTRSTISQLSINVPFVTEAPPLRQEDLELDMYDEDEDNEDNMLDDTQEEVFVDCEQDVSMLPLISSPCESISVEDGSEILCDTKDYYRLEADV